MLSLSLGYIKIYFKDNFMKDACVFIHGSGNEKAKLWYIRFLVNNGMTVFVPNNEEMYIHKKIVRLYMKQVTQIIDLIHALNYDGKIALYGVNEGAPIVAKYTNKKRNKIIDKKVLLGYNPGRWKNKSVIRINIVGKNNTQPVCARGYQDGTQEVTGRQMCKVYALENCTYDLVKDKLLLKKVLQTVVHTQM